MPIEPVVALLARQSRASLTTMSNEIREQIESLAVQLQLVDRAIFEKDAAARAARDSSDPVEATGASAGRSNKRAIFRDILAQRPDHDWTPGDVGAELKRRGIPANGAAVRVMLRRMAEAGEVVRTPRGGYMLASEGNPAENGATNGFSEPSPETLLFAAPGHGTDNASS